MRTFALSVNTLAVLVLSAAPVLSGCGGRAGDPPEEAEPAATDAGPGAEPAAPDGGARFEPSTAGPDRPGDEVVEPAAVDHPWTVGIVDVGGGERGVSTLRSVRTARHDGFDRIVLDFGADPVPGYHLEYIDRPVRQCGSGDPVPLAGDAWLQIRTEPAYAHTPEGAPTIADRARRPGHPNVLELRLTCDFEAQVEWVAGVAYPGQYRVFTLRDPARLVVDVRHR